MKITKTYSIEESVFNAFDRVAKRKNINKSSFIEDAIQVYLEECGIDYVDKLFCSKLNKDFIVQILDQDDTYYNLSDGSKIQRILFMQLFEEDRGVDPEVFMNQSEKVFEDIANVIKKIDTEKLEPFSAGIKNNIKIIDDINMGAEEENLIKQELFLKKVQNDVRTGKFQSEIKDDLGVQLVLNKILEMKELVHANRSTNPFQVLEHDRHNKDLLSVRIDVINKLVEYKDSL